MRTMEDRRICSAGGGDDNLDQHHASGTKRSLQLIKSKWLGACSATNQLYKFDLSQLDTHEDVERFTLADKLCFDASSELVSTVLTS